MKSLVALIIWACAVSPSLAHEFWIDSPRFQVENGQNIVAFTKNGEGFKGIDLAYFERRAALFDQVSPSGIRQAVTPRAGDSPVFDRPVTQSGLWTLLYRSTPDKLTYRGWDKFQAFVTHKDLGDVLTEHRARGLDEALFKETYTRFAKALFAVGPGAGKDALRGQELEFLAQANPYTDDLSGGLPVRLYYQNAPRANAQIEIFERAPDGSVAVHYARTDAEGRARIPMRAGHSYLLDHVVLRIPDAALAEKTGAVWETLWAALTFAVPAAKETQ